MLLLLRKPCRIAVATVILLAPEAGAFYTVPPPTATTTNSATSMLSRPSAATQHRHPISSTCRRRSLAPLRMAPSSDAAAAAGGDDDLRGKVAVVTGSSRGIGKGIAVTLGQHGCTVYVTGRSVEGNTTDKASRSGVSRNMNGGHFFAFGSIIFELVMGHCCRKHIPWERVLSGCDGLIVHGTKSYTWRFCGSRRL